MMLSTRLSYLRKQHKLNQTEMAKKLGMGRTTYAMYEQGNRSPDYNTLNQIADFFDVTTDYLLGRTDDPKENLDFYQSDFAKDYGFTPPSDEDERVFFQDFHKMTKEEKEEAIRYIEIQREMRKKKEENN